MAITKKGTGEEVAGEVSPCSKCGCADIRHSKQGSFCRYCGKRWIRRVAPKAPPEDVIGAPGGPLAYHVLRCPSCGSDRTRITSTRRPVRYHKCKDCDKNFKTFEKEL